MENKYRLYDKAGQQEGNESIDVALINLVEILEKFRYLGSLDTASLEVVFEELKDKIKEKFENA